MNEVLKDGEDSGDGEEEGETAAAKETEEISSNDAENPKTHRGEEKYSQRKKTTTERVEQMHQKMYQRQEKSEKTTVNPKNSRRLQRCQQHPRNQVCKEESTHYKD